MLELLMASGAVDPLESNWVYFPHMLLESFLVLQDEMTDFADPIDAVGFFVSEASQVI
jgi:hypothetical protein